MTQQATITDELAFGQPYGEQEKQVLTPEAVEFLAELVSRFTPERNRLLAARMQQQQAIDDVPFQFDPFGEPFAGALRCLGCRHRIFRFRPSSFQTRIARGGRGWSFAKPRRLPKPGLPCGPAPATHHLYRIATTPTQFPGLPFMILSIASPRLNEPGFIE